MRPVVLLALLVALAGCSKSYLEYKYGTAEPQVLIKQVSVAGMKAKVIYAWSPYNSIMIGNPDSGEVCLLPADGAKVAKSDRSLNLGITGAAGSFAGASVGGSSKREDNFEPIAVEDAKAAAAENSLSVLCLFRLNNWLDPKDLKDMYLKTLETTLATAKPEAAKPAQAAATATETTETDKTIKTTTTTKTKKGG